MPTLLQINVASNMLSIGKICEDIAITAQRHGWTTYIAYGRWAKPGVNKEIRIAGMWNTYLHYIEQKLFDNEGLASRWVTKRLVKKIEKINPDVIQLHDLHDHYLNFPILFDYLRKSQKPVVWTFHDCWAFTGRCYYFDMVNCSKWKSGCHDCPMHHVYPNNSLLDRSVRNFELRKKYFADMENLTIVSCSHWISDLTKESMLKDKRIEVFHNGVNLSRFKPVTKKSDSTKFRILGVAAVWEPRKGFNDFLKLRECLSRDTFDITLVGLKEDQIKSLPEGITGITRTTSIDEMVQLYSDADVFVNPTYSDNFPTTNIEALACGTPVITYRTGGSPEAIDSKTGIVVDQGNVSVLANSIMYLRENPLSSDDCRKRAEECFDKDKCFEKYVELYEELLSK